MSDEQKVSTPNAPKREIPEQEVTADTTAPVTKKSVSPAAVIAAVIALLAFLGYMAYQSFGPLTINLFPKEDQETHVQRLARDSQGDYNRLSPEDKKWMDSISRGNGTKYIRSAYEKQTKTSAPK